MKYGAFYFPTDYDSAGIDSALFEIPDAGRDQILAKLDEYAKLIG